MTRRLMRRVGAAGLMAALCVTVLAIPASAGGPTTRWVDDGGSAGPSGCAGVQPYTSIQDAIDDSSPGDKVHVCPGDYEEQLTITTRRVTVRSIVRRAADILAPADLTDVDGVSSLIHVDLANKVVVRGFDLWARSAPSCEQVDVAILIEGSINTVVRGNRVRVGGTDTLGACGYGYGVVVTGEAVGGPPTAAATPATEVMPASADVIFNRIRDFSLGGILIEGHNTDALVWRNQILYYHVAESAGAFSTGGVPCPGGVNCLFIDTFGIGIEDQASARVRGNLVKSGPDACIECIETSGHEASFTPALLDGITALSLSGLDDPTRIVHNAVFRVLLGIRIDGGSSSAVIAFNDVTLTDTGIELLGLDLSHVHDNRSTDNNIGIYVAPLSGDNLIEDNDFLGNEDYDCIDDSSGSGTEGSANTWTNNAGEPDLPDGICTVDDAAP